MFLFEVEGAKNVILDTIKRAEDSDQIIVRLHEAFGGRAMFKLRRYELFCSTLRGKREGSVLTFNHDQSCSLVV